MNEIAVTAIDVKKFANFCVYARSVFWYSHVLYQETSEEDKGAMSRTANLFFGDLSQILVEYVVLQICKITDPAKDVRGNLNHTVDFFLSYAELGGRKPRMIEVATGMMAFRKKVKPARDKLISHLDRDAVMADKALGAACEEEWSAFWLQLQEFASLLHEQYFAEPFYVNAAGNVSDPHMLLAAVRHFDETTRQAPPRLGVSWVNEP